MGVHRTAEQCWPFDHIRSWPEKNNAAQSPWRATGLWRNKFSLWLHLLLPAFHVYVQEMGTAKQRRVCFYLLVDNLLPRWKQFSSKTFRLNQWRRSLWKQVTAFGASVKHDHGSQLILTLLRDLLLTLGNKHSTTTAHQPVSKGLVKRLCGNLKAATAATPFVKWLEGLPWDILGSCNNVEKECIHPELIYTTSTCLPGNMYSGVASIFCRPFRGSHIQPPGIGCVLRSTSILSCLLSFDIIRANHILSRDDKYFITGHNDHYDCQSPPP